MPLNRTCLLGSRKAEGTDPFTTRAELRHCCLHCCAAVSCLACPWFSTRVTRLFLVVEVLLSSGAHKTCPSRSTGTTDVAVLLVPFPRGYAGTVATPAPTATTTAPTMAGRASRPSTPTSSPATLRPAARRHACPPSRLPACWCSCRTLGLAPAATPTHSTPTSAGRPSSSCFTCATAMGKSVLSCRGGSHGGLLMACFLNLFGLWLFCVLSETGGAV